MPLDADRRRRRAAPRLASPRGPSGDGPPSPSIGRPPRAGRRRPPRQPHPFPAVPRHAACGGPAGAHGPSRPEESGSCPPRGGLRPHESVGGLGRREELVSWGGGGREGFAPSGLAVAVPFRPRPRRRRARRPPLGRIGPPPARRRPARRGGRPRVRPRRRQLPPEGLRLGPASRSGRGAPLPARGPVAAPKGPPPPASSLPVGLRPRRSYSIICILRETPCFTGFLRNMGYAESVCFGTLGLAPLG